MKPYVFIGVVSTGDGSCIITTDKSRIKCERDIHLTQDDLAYLATIKSEQQLQWYNSYELFFQHKVNFEKFRRLWEMKPLERLLSCECNTAAKDYLQYHGYKLPVDTKIF